MTVTELHRTFRFGLDKMDGLNYPNFRPEEIDLLLNQGQDRLVKQRYSKDNYKRESFEETQKRIEDLEGILKNVTIIPAPNNNIINYKENLLPNSVFCKLPDDHWFIIEEMVIQRCVGCTDSNINIRVDYDNTQTQVQPVGTPGPIKTFIGRIAEVRPITHLKFLKNIKSAFRKPDKDKVLRLMYSYKIELIPSTNCSILVYQCRYIRKPVRINITNNTTCELPDYLHNEIIDEAIKIALEGIEAKRTQTFTPIIDTQKE